MDIARESARHAAGRRSTWVSVGVNLGLTGVQVAAGLWAGSQGLVADGLHSLSDLVADLVVLLANHHSAKGADADHHYGHRRYETAASLVLGALLLAAGAGMLLGAARKLEAPAATPVQPLALYVALGTLAVKEGLFRYMLSVARRVGSSLLEANAWHARSDAASSLVVALGLTGSLLGYPRLDPVAALLVGLLVGRAGWGFAWEALHDLMDRAAPEAEVDRIRACLLATPGVLGLHDLRTRRAGDLILVDVHLEVDGQLTVAQGAGIAEEARRRVLAELPVLDVMTHLDPVTVAQRAG